MAYMITHFYEGGTKDQYDAVVSVVHPPGGLPVGQVYHAAGPTDGGWLVGGRSDQPPPLAALAALAAGLPDCAGVALGLDRLLMCRLGADKLDAVMAFSLARA